MILYTLISGRLPFELKTKDGQPRNNADVVADIVRGNINYTGKPWSIIAAKSLYGEKEDRSDVCCVDLLKKMLIADPEKRISISGLLTHPWVLKTMKSYHSCEDEYYHSLEGIYINVLECIICLIFIIDRYSQ